MDQRSKYLRQLVLRGLSGGGRGHIGSSMSLIEILRVLYDNFLRYKPDDAMWEGRDRFILSKGHGCLALYAILSDKGFFAIEELDKFCKAGAKLGGHPQFNSVPGIEASTGALGHGLSLGVGMAMAVRMRNLKSRIVVVMGDGEINEGSVWEAAMAASKHHLNNLIVLIDYNKMQSYSTTEEVLNLEPMLDKWRAFGFESEELDGHNVQALELLFSRLPLSSNKPSLIVCHTIKGKGISFAEGKENWHHKSNLSDQDILDMQHCLS